MMNLMRKTACAFTVLALSATSVWAGTGEEAYLTVTGKVKPSACQPGLGSNGILNYGVFRGDDLNATDYNDLGIKKVDFTITCLAPAKIAIYSNNGRKGSVVSDQAEGGRGFAVAPINLFGEAGVEAAGLGTASDGAKIGGFAARIVPDTAQADASPVEAIVSVDNGGSWAPATIPTVTSNTQLVSWGAPGANNPISMETLAAELEVNAYLNKMDALDLSKVVSLDGLATIEIWYL